MPNLSIRFHLSQQHARLVGSPIWGDSFYEPSDDELAALTSDERAVVSVFQGEDAKGHRLDIFAMPPWSGIVSRLRGATPPAEAQLAIGEQQIRAWLSGSKEPLKLTGERTELAVLISTYFNAMMLYVTEETHPHFGGVANAFVRRAANLVSALGEPAALQLAHELPAAIVLDRVVFDREFKMHPRAEPRLLQRTFHERLTKLCGEVQAWLPPGTVLEVGPVSRIDDGRSKWTGVCVLVAHPGSRVRNVVVFSVEAD